MLATSLQDGPSSSLTPSIPIHAQCLALRRTDLCSENVMTSENHERRSGFCSS